MSSSETPGPTTDGTSSAAPAPAGSKHGRAGRNLPAAIGLGVVLGAYVVLSLIFFKPAFVLLVAHWGFGLSGLPLSIVVLMGGLPIGANALIFAQRYQTHEAESATAIVMSTFGYAFTLPFWLFVLSRVA
jgi:predicted permease